MDIEDLNGDSFGEFNGGKAILDGDNVWIYVSPK